MIQRLFREPSGPMMSSLERLQSTPISLNLCHCIRVELYAGSDPETRGQSSVAVHEWATQGSADLQGRCMS